MGLSVLYLMTVKSVVKQLPCVLPLEHKDAIIYLRQLYVLMFDFHTLHICMMLQLPPVHSPSWSCSDSNAV